MAVTKEISDGTTTINFNVNLNRTMVILSPFILSAVFIILKFTGIVSWSLLTVLSPLWVGIALHLSFMAVFYVGAFIYFMRKG